MSWLTAALAFALSMLLFMTMVSMIAESIHKIFGLRRKGLQLMMGRLYDEVLTQHFAMPSKTAAAAGARGSPHERDLFLQCMTETRAFPDG